jgi:hypothetical protein
MGISQVESRTTLALILRNKRLETEEVSVESCTKSRNWEPW